MVQYAYAPEPVARAFNNYLSEGLRGQAWYDYYRGTVDPIRRLGVSLSLYHLNLTFMNDMSMGEGRNLTKFIGGLFGGRPEDIAAGLKGIGKASVGAEFVQHQLLAAKTTQEFYNPGAHPELKPIVDDYIRAGGRFPKPETMDGMAKGFSESLRDALVAAGKLHPFEAGSKALDIISKPLMEYVVPRAKLGAFAAMRQEIYSKLARELQAGKISQADIEFQLTERLQKATQHIDSIYGEVVYDNLLWNRKVKDMMFFLINYPGWNIGSFRWIMGMGRGGWQATKKVFGKGEGVDQIAGESLKFGLGLLIATGIQTTLMHWLINGKPPDDPSELYWKGVWTGGYNKSGGKEFIRPASYMRDVTGILTDPVGTIKAKEGYFMRTVADVLSNTDYFGNEIRTPGMGLGGIPQNLKEYAQFGGKNLLPFTARNIMEGRSTWGKYGGAVGWSLTPKRLTATPAEKEMNRYSEITRPALVPHEVQEKRQLKTEIMDHIHQKDPQGFMGSLAAGP